MARIAVVGAGLAGLAAAWWLARAGHGVTLFEAAREPGFTAHNVVVEHAGAPHRIDVPLRVFYPGYYPTLLALYAELGIASEPVSYAATLCGPDRQPFFRYRNLRWGARSLGTMAPQDLLLGPAARRIARSALRLNREAARALAAGQLGELSIGEYLAQAAYPAEFVEGLVLPALCTIATCGFADGRAMPACVVLDYLARGLSSQAVRRVMAGADEVLRRILPAVEAIHCSAAVGRVQRRADGVTVFWTDRSRGSAHEAHFEHAVLATPAHLSARLLAAGGDGEAAGDAQILAAFRYTALEVLTHGDPALLPARQRDWSPVNLHVDPATVAPESTIWINRVQPALRNAAPVFQTVHPAREPDPALLLGRSRFERPLVTRGTAAALARLHQGLASPGRRLWFCGSYAEAGIPLLESAVASAKRVVHAIGTA